MAHTATISTAEDARSAPAAGRRAMPVVAATGAVVSIGSIGAALWLHVRADDPPPLSLPDVIVAVAYPLLATVVLRARPGHRAGLLLVPTALLGPYVLAGTHAHQAALTGTDDAWPAQVSSWLAMWGFSPYLVVVALVPLHLPDGRIEGRGWRRWATAVAVTVGLGVVAAMVLERPADVSPLVDNPVGWDHAALEVALRGAGLTSFVLGGPTAVAYLVLRFRRTVGVERARLGWVLLGVGTLVVCALASIPFSPGPLGNAVLAVGMLAVPLAVAVAVVRHDLFDTVVVLDRAVVYAVCTAVVLATYAVVVALAGGVADGTRWAVPVTALAALAAASGVRTVERGVDRLLYGSRRDPYALVVRTGDRIERATDPVAALGALLDEVRVLLRVPWATAVPSDPTIEPVSVGEPGPHFHYLTLVAHGEAVGELRVGHRQPGERMRRSDRTALAEIARRAATLVWSAGLVDELRRSRDEAQRRGEQVVIAREEERRRLRRDLHDGVGPDLAGIALQLGRLARQADDPDLAARATALQEQLRTTVAVVRGVVDGLGPPALDELGLVGALRAHALVGGADDAAVTVTVGDGGLGEPSAAVQVAAYRIATEALANARRHGRARTVQIELGREGDAVVVRVADDGIGLHPDRCAPGSTGVGIGSMRERAAELGGSLTIGDRPEGGTLVEARLPVVAR